MTTLPSPRSPRRSGAVGFAAGLAWATAAFGIWAVTDGRPPPVESPAGLALLVTGLVGWLLATLAGCFGPLPHGRRPDPVVRAAIAGSTASLVLALSGLGLLVAAALA